MEDVEAGIVCNVDDDGTNFNEDDVSVEGNPFANSYFRAQACHWFCGDELDDSALVVRTDGMCAPCVVESRARRMETDDRRPVRFGDLGRCGR